MPQVDNLAVYLCAGWLTEGLDRGWVGRHGWWLGRQSADHAYQPRAACSDRLFLLGNALVVNRRNSHTRLFLRFGHRPTSGLADGLLGAGHPLLAVHVSVEPYLVRAHF